MSLSLLQRGLVRRATSWVAHRTVKGSDGLTHQQRETLVRRYLNAGQGAPLTGEQLERFHAAAAKVALASFPASRPRP